MEIWNKKRGRLQPEPPLDQTDLLLLSKKKKKLNEIKKRGTKQTLPHVCAE